MKKMHTLFIAEVVLAICLLVAIIVVTINNNHGPVGIDHESSVSNSSDNGAGENDLTDDEVLEYDSLVYRANVFMAAENNENVKLSESAEQRLSFVIYAYSMNLQHDYKGEQGSFAYISLPDLKSDYEALYGENYNFDADYESASASITEKCPTNITDNSIICIKDTIDFSYSYSFNAPTINGQGNSYRMTGSYQKIDNNDNDNTVNLRYFFDFKDSHLLEFIAPAET